MFMNNNNINEHVRRLNSHQPELRGPTNEFIKHDREQGRKKSLSERGTTEGLWQKIWNKYVLSVIACVLCVRACMHACVRVCVSVCYCMCVVCCIRASGFVVLGRK